VNKGLKINESEMDYKLSNPTRIKLVSDSYREVIRGSPLK